jgi:hypothetical protein
MKGDSITLTTTEQRRLIVLNHLRAGALTNEGAAELLHLSVRQVQRLHAEYRFRGAAPPRKCVQSVSIGSRPLLLRPKKGARLEAPAYHQGLACIE